MNAVGANRLRPRWWPAVTLLALAGAALAGIQFLGDAPQQARNLRSYITCGLAFIALLAWLIFYSRLRSQRKLVALGVLALVHLAVFATVRIAGVDGNLVPILAWRWEKLPSPDHAIASPTVVKPLGGPPSAAEDWPQFLGPTRNGRAPALALETNWVAHPPAEVWRAPVGHGWSGFAVVGGRAITLEQHGEEEMAVCRDASTGSILWSQAWPARYSTTIGGTGPRTVPAIVGERVLVAGATGWLGCLDLHTGAVLWSTNVLEANQARVPEWGYSVSPLIVDERVIVSVGGTGGRSLVAYDLASGGKLWHGGDQELSYSSPVLAELGGQAQIVVFNANGVAGHQPATGAVLWSSAFDGQNVHVAAPLVLGEERVLFSAGYGHGSELFRVQKSEDGPWQAEPLWRSRRMKAKFANLVLHEGHVYGPDDGILACISAETGEPGWKDGRYGHGQMILAGGRLLMMGEDGHLVLIEPRPDRLRELGRVRVFTDKTWNPPALAGNLLFVRNDREAACLRLALAALR